MNRDSDENTLLAVTPKHARALHPALVFLSGELIAVPIPLERDEVILGRAIEADVRVNDARASRMHARISVEHDALTGEARYRVTDLGSTNGTLLNGHSVKDALLQDGDKITVGEHLLRFELLDDIDREFQKQIHRLLAHDELTGLLTSKSFFSELRREAARAETEARPFCVLMMDLDHFKAVNDRHGHLVGSQTLEDVSACITQALRAGDVAARFGGEEFAAFLLDASCAQGLVAAERVRAAIEGHWFAAARRGSASERSGEVLRLTISVGVAAFPDDARDPIELVELADTALYRAKNTGRNRVSAYCIPPLDAGTSVATPLPPRTE
ncbi:MAG: GGDEF domain-containing protein [Acidobacteria bacterium]|nr:GGDEF domain-containing protein [Acidobacteriota bacterium]